MTDNFFFGGKILQRQNVSASKRRATKRFGRLNVDTKKSRIRSTNMQSQAQKKDGKLKFI